MTSEEWWDKWRAAEERGEPLPCGCWKCIRAAGVRHVTWFVVCGECGNKRCCAAEDCDFICTGSNELGQTGVRKENQT